MDEIELISDINTSANTNALTPEFLEIIKNDTINHLKKNNLKVL